MLHFKFVVKILFSNVTLGGDAFFLGLGVQAFIGRGTALSWGMVPPFPITPMLGGPGHTGHPPMQSCISMLVEIILDFYVWCYHPIFIYFCCNPICVATINDIILTFVFIILYSCVIGYNPVFIFLFL